MSNVTEAVKLLEQFRSVLLILQKKDDAAMLDRPIELLTAPREPVAATADDWSVRHESDEAGEWTYLEVDEPGSDQVTVVNVSLSDAEAQELAIALINRRVVIDRRRES